MRREGWIQVDGQGVGVADNPRIIGPARAVAAVFGLKLGKLEADFGHLAGLGKGQRQLSGGTVGEFGGETGPGDLAIRRGRWGMWMTLEPPLLHRG